MSNPQHGAAGTGDEEGRRWSMPPTSRKPVPDLVGDRVLELVRAGELAPGDRLPTEPELARMMSVARSSVRTGLQRLEARGVVEVNRGRGWFVSAEPDRSAADLMLDRLAGEDFDVAEVMEVRIALETTAAALAAARAPRGQMDEIVKLARAHHEADSEDTGTLLRTDEDFHRAVIDGAANAYLRAVYDMITPLVAEWRERTFSNAHVHMRSAMEHNQIAAWLRRRDETGVRTAMTSHLLGLYQDAIRERQEAGRAGENPTATLSTFIDIEDAPMFQDGEHG